MEASSCDSIQNASVNKNKAYPIIPNEKQEIQRFTDAEV